MNADDGKHLYFKCCGKLLGDELAKVEKEEVTKGKMEKVAKNVEKTAKVKKGEKVEDGK